MATLLRKNFFESYNPSFLGGFAVSFLLHVLLFAFALIVLHTSAAKKIKPLEIYTVTLEGGKRLGGANQIPTEAKNAKASKEKPTNVPTEQLKQKETEVAAKQLEIKKSTVVDKLEEEKREAEKKKAEDEKRQKEIEAKAQAKKEADEKKKKADEAKKKEAEEKKRAEELRVRRDQKLEDAIKKLSEHTQQESYAAGGTGVGAARIGGQGTGGGKLASLEFIAYRNQLEQHIKSGWHTIPGSTILQAGIRVKIAPDGVILDARVDSSSGNTAFDESALRAVFKASPVPIPPESIAEQFRDVIINFDSHNR